jgi:hypothetical protein
MQVASSTPRHSQPRSQKLETYAALRVVETTEVIDSHMVRTPGPLLRVRILRNYSMLGSLRADAAAPTWGPVWQI